MNFRIYAETDGTLTRVGRAIRHLDKALKAVARFGNAEIRIRLPSGREALFAVKVLNKLKTVDGNTLHLPDA